MAIYNSRFCPNSPADLVRIGAQFDGGYVISQRMIEAAGGLLSFGLSDEWEFECEFTRMACVPSVCFDPTVDEVFWAKRFAAGLVKGLISLDVSRLRRGLRMIDYWRFFDGKRNRHIRKAVGYSGLESLSFLDAIVVADMPSPLMLKMDIEGWEYRILPQLIDSRSEFIGLAIEFHDVDLHEQRIADFVEAISDRFVLIHFHANNHTTVGPDGLALAFELTFMARSLLHPGERLVMSDLPIADLDAPNIPGKKEAVVSFAKA